MMGDGFATWVPGMRGQPKTVMAAAAFSAKMSRVVAER